MAPPIYALLALGLTLTLLTADAGSLPPWYHCTCSNGSSHSAAHATPCVCPSTSPPGGLRPSSTPQFILFTHDDAITSTTNKAFRSILDGKQSANGCKPVATMFVTLSTTDCSLLHQMHKDGYEIADHTVHHLEMNGMSRRQVVAEVVTARAEIASKCGIPAADIVGFRQPFLLSNPTVRQVLYDNGFLYDSTILEDPTWSLSDGMEARVWPYTMGDGIPQNCAFFAPSQTCTQAERYPGMFEVPAWDLSALGLYSMDYGANDNNSAFDILKANFDAAYAGNRAPLPIYIHSPWFSQGNHLADVKKFVDYALGKPDVYFVTMRQLLAWMQNPLPASALTPTSLGCGQPGGAGPASTTVSATSAAATPAPAPAPAPSPSPATPSLSPAASTAATPSPAAPVPASAPAPALVPAPTPTMPPSSGLNITLWLTGVNATMAQAAKPLLLAALVAQLPSDPATTYVARMESSMDAQPSAGSIQQLVVVIVAGASTSTPLQMLSVAQAAVSDGTVAGFLSAYGASLAQQPSLVAFENGAIISTPTPVPASAPAPVPASAPALLPTPPHSGAVDGSLRIAASAVAACLALFLML